MITTTINIIETKKPGAVAGAGLKSSTDIYCAPDIYDIQAPGSS